MYKAGAGERMEGGGGGNGHATCLGKYFQKMALSFSKTASSYLSKKVKSWEIFIFCRGRGAIHPTFDRWG